MTQISDLHRTWRQDADYRDAYDALGEEFNLARSLVEARTAAGLSQSQLAKKDEGFASYLARIEGERCVDRLKHASNPRKRLARVYKSTSNRSLRADARYRRRGRFGSCLQSP